MNVYRIKERLAQQSCTVPKPIDLYWTQTVYFVVHLLNQGILNVSEALTDPKMAFRKQSVTQSDNLPHAKTNKQKCVCVCVCVCVLGGGGIKLLHVRTKLIENSYTKQKEEERTRVIMQRTKSKILFED